MAAGLQCWDASGRLVVDLGDYSVKLVGRYSVGITSGAKSVSYSVAGVTGNNSFAAVVSWNLNAYVPAEYYAKTKNGGFDVINGTGLIFGYNATLTVEVYQFV